MWCLDILIRSSFREKPEPLDLLDHQERTVTMVSTELMDFPELTDATEPTESLDLLEKSDPLDVT